MGREGVGEGGRCNAGGECREWGERGSGRGEEVVRERV